MVEKLVPDPFPKNWVWTYLWIISLKFHSVIHGQSPPRSPGFWFPTTLLKWNFSSVATFKTSKQILDLLEANRIISQNISRMFYIFLKRSRDFLKVLLECSISFWNVLEISWKLFSVLKCSFIIYYMFDNVCDKNLIINSKISK